MAQQQGQNEGFVDSIFNFIFSSNKKNVPQRPPQNLQGISGNEMAYALGEVAMNPAIYANDEILTFINEPFDNIHLAESTVKLDEHGNAVRTRVTANNLSEFVSDPEGFIEKAFQRADGDKKAARKLNMIRGFGGFVDLGVGSVLAKRAGASSIDSLEMGQVLGNEYMTGADRNIKGEELVARSSAYEMAQAKKLNYNEANKLALSFASVMDSSKIELMDLEKKSKVDKLRLQRVITKKLSNFGTWPPDQIDELFNKYLDKLQDYQAKGVNVEGADWNFGVVDRSIPKDDHKKINYAGGVNEWKKSKNPADKIRALKYEELDNQVKLLKQQDPANPKIIQLERQKKNIEIWQVANGPNMKVSRWLGEGYQNYLAFNQYVVQGGLIPAVVSGDFFDIRKNNMSPSKTHKFKIDGVEHEITIPRDDMKSSLYTGLTGLYYFTPGSIARTLFVNGEGFAYRHYLKQQNIRNIIQGSDSLYNHVVANSSLYSTLLGGVSITDQDAVLKALSSGDNYVKFLDILNNNKGSFTDAELLKVVGQLTKLQKKLKGSLGSKWANMISSFTSKLSIKNNVNKIVGWGLVTVFGKKLGQQMKGFFVEGQIGLKKLARTLARKAVTAIGQALGFATTGGLANILILGVTEVIYFVGEKMLKPVVKVAAFFVWGFILIFFMLFLTLFSWLDGLNPFNASTKKQFDTAGNTAPIFCEQCGGGFAAAGQVYDEQGNLVARAEVPADSNMTPPVSMADVECPLQPDPLKCTQRPYGSFSHASVNAVDVIGPPPAYWYAPSDGVVTRALWAYQNSRLSWQKCGGIVHFHSEEHGVTYVLVHVLPYVAQNERVTKGTPIAKIALEKDGNINFSNTSGTCATGAHFHLEVRGSSVYADRYYREFLNCNLSSCP